MKSLFQFTVSILLLVAAAMSACNSRHPEELPVPKITIPLTIAEAHGWYNASHASIANDGKPKTGLNRGMSTTTEPTDSTVQYGVLNWERAFVAETGPYPLVLVPFFGDEALFADNPYRGTRYLMVAREESSDLQGLIVEVLLKRADAPLDTAAMFTALYVAHQHNEPVVLPGTGYGLFYTADYNYLAGVQAQDGNVTSEDAQLHFQPRANDVPQQKGTQPGNGGSTNIQQAGSPCTDWYNARTGDYITSTGNCGGGGGGGVPTGYNGGGGPGGMGNGPGGYGGHGGPSGSSPSLAPTVILNISLTPCQTAVLSNMQMLNNGLLAFIVQKFGGTSTGYNWRLKAGSLPTGTFGSTGSYNRTSKVIETTFDSYQMRNSTDLSVARTMLHESVHAYLRTYFFNTPLYVRTSYPDLIAAWDLGRLGTNPNIYHHNEMGQGWIGDLAWALKQYGQNKGYNLPDQFYSDLAWGGLEESQAFRNLPQADKDRITDVIRIEATGKDVQGNNQPQRGRNAGCY